jgi:hypothetical protein
MPSGRLMKHLLFLLLLGFGVIAAATAASAQTAPPAFVSAIGDNTNVVFVENHIVIDRPANEIFDFVSTPGNVYKCPVLETLRNDRVACLRFRRAECDMDGFAQTLRG